MSAAILITRLLQDKQLTMRQVSDALGMKTDTAETTIRRMRKARQIYIAKWTPLGNGRPRPIYALGDLPDAPQPKPQTKAQKAKREWQRTKRDSERYLNYLAYARAKYLRSKPAAVDPMLAQFAGLFGKQQEAA